ncbi:hypothetical protein MRX96_011086 [Rhipicephalus microplus]
MPSNDSRIVVPFPPTEDEAEKAHRRKLKQRYEKMHDALERGSFVSLEDFLATFDVRSDAEYMDILRAGFTRPCVLHHRTPAQKMVNPFTPWIAKVLDSNMDLQVILDHYACATYVIDYVNKADRGMSDLHKAVMQILEEKPEMEYSAIVRSLGVTMLKGVEMSAQEAAWFLLGQEMSEKSREVVYIPTCYPEERVRVRKTNEELANVGASSTDVWKLNIVQRYEGRPPEMEDVCLADFASKYKRGYGLREHPIIIRYRHYTAADQPEDYMREQVLLYVPFRNEAVDVLDHNKYLETFEANKDLIATKHRQYNIGNDDDIVDQLIEEHRIQQQRQEDAAAVDAAVVAAVCERAVNDGDLPKRLWLHFDDATTTVPAHIVDFDEILHVAPSEDVRLSCRFLGAAPVHWEWKHGNTLVQRSNRTELSSDGSLNLRLVDATSAGNYTCHVRNRLANDRRTVALIVRAHVDGFVLKVVSKTATSLQMTASGSAVDDQVIQVLEVHLKSENGEWQQRSLAGRQNDTYHLDGLQCGTRYQLYAVAFLASGRREQSDLLALSTIGSPPVAPNKEDIVRTLNSSHVQVVPSAWRSGGCPPDAA